jgi:hypothetical protein
MCLYHAALIGGSFSWAQKPAGVLVLQQQVTVSFVRQASMVSAPTLFNQSRHLV